VLEQSAQTIYDPAEFDVPESVTPFEFSPAIRQATEQAPASVPVQAVPTAPTPSRPSPDFENIKLNLPSGSLGVSGPLPVPGSYSSGPLLAASGSELESMIDEGFLATQRLYIEGDADTDRTTDINLAAYNLPPAPTKEQRPAAKSASSKSASGGTSSRSGGSKSAQDEPINKMKQLKVLLDSGFITEVDYEAKKSRHPGTLLLVKRWTMDQRLVAWSLASHC